jgi:branched-chain amino acid aminotransferase
VAPRFTASLASVDGEIMLASRATVPATDAGLLRGDGAFEMIRVYDGRPFALEQHLARLERSASNLRLPVDVEAVRADAHRLLAHAGPGPDHEALRIVLTRGGCRLLLTEPLPPTAERIRLASVTYAPTRILDGVKSLSYASNMLATRIAKERGADEALLVTPHGRVLEAPTSSIFWVAAGELLTPPLEDHILASITRAHVIELTGAREQACTLADLQNAEEAFLASTTREVQAVAAIDSKTFDGIGPVTVNAASALRSRIEAELST